MTPMVILPLAAREDQNGPMAAAVLLQFFKDVHSVNVDIVHVPVECGNSQVRVYLIEGSVVNLVVMDEEILAGYFLC